MIASSRRNVLSVACVLGLCVALSACGSSSAGSGSKAPTTGPASGSGTSNSSSPANSSSTSAGSTDLSAIVLQAGDIPATYKGAPYEADPSDAADQAELVSCIGGKDVSADVTGDEHSDDFSLGDVSISSEAKTYASQSDVDATVALLTSPKINSCYEAEFRTKATAGLPAGSTVDAVDITVKPGSNGGPTNVVAVGAGSLTVTVGGKNTTLNVSVAFMTGPSLVAEVDFENVDAAIPSDVAGQAVTAVAARAAKG